MRRERDGAPQSILAETEEALIGFFTEGLRFEMQAGHMERAIANLQVALEYSCFAPAIPVGMLTKQLTEQILSVALVGMCSDCCNRTCYVCECVCYACGWADHASN